MVYIRFRLRLSSLDPSSPSICISTALMVVDIFLHVSPFIPLLNNHMRLLFVDACPSFGPSFFSPHRGAPTSLFLACHGHIYALPALTHSARRHPPSARAARHTARAPIELYVSIVPLRVAIVRARKYARTVPALAKSPEPLPSWVVLWLWLWPCPSKYEAYYAAYFLITCT
jgi:hypothetical protein